MKTIKVKFCDGFRESDDVFMPILQRHYNVEFSEHPDFLIYSTFGKEHLKYDCVKIFTTGECVTPNFNECDYATGFDYLTLGDRYLRLPLCSIMFRNGENMLSLAKQRGKNLPAVSEKAFCSFVVSNGNCMPERDIIFDLLSAYKKVDSGGRYRNNIGGAVENKLLFDSRHKFCIAFENESYPGYITEKLADAFAAGTVPIYYGDPTVGEQFNERAFVNCHKFESLEKASEFVRELDANDEAYNAMLHEAIGGESIPGLDELEQFLCSIFDREPREARRRPHSPKAEQVERSALFAKKQRFLLHFQNNIFSPKHGGV